MPQQLPPRPNLDHLKKQAKDVLRLFRRCDPQWRLADAQHAIARGYGFRSWPALKLHVEAVRHQRPPVAPRSEPELAARVEPNRDNPSGHFLAGTWISSPTNSPPGNSQLQNDGIVLEFEVTADDIQLTQVGTDAAGHQVAMKMSICADGQEHPVPFGDGVVLQAQFTGARVLETAIKSGEGTLWMARYEVSPDRRSLVVSGGDQLLVFERI